MNEPKKKSSFVRRTIIAIAIVFPLGLLIGRPYFVRARDHARTNSCICNLRQMDGAIHCWSLEQKKNPEDGVTLNDITPFLKHTIQCPQGGKYTVGPAASNVPTCSIAGHALPP